ncbi:MAG: YdcF family protein [Oscillospiraceae bacterium]|nr:YdcF family protein [Oscillospiraceae bacterium]
MLTKGTLLRTCLAVLFAVGFAIFLFPPVFSGVFFNIGNTAGMLACAALFFITIYWSKLLVLLSENKAFRFTAIIISAIAVALVILAAVISAFMISAANSPPPENTTVIILGCKVKGERPSLMLSKRIDAAYEYLSANPSAMCIVSGGQGSDEIMSEAECMKRVLVEKGIAEERIIMEDKSTSTDENLCFSLEKMQENGLSGSVTIVTSEFHQLRAKMIAENYDLETYAVSAPTVWYLLPTYWVREWFGVTYQYIFK